MAEQRQTYTAEFQREAVRLVTEQRDGVAETARNWGLHVPMLRRWNPEATAHPQHACPGHGRLPPAQDALRQRRDAGKRLRMERDMFTKARRCFVNEPSCGRP